jgi:hypothetical protein
VSPWWDSFYWSGCTGQFNPHFFTIINDPSPVIIP